MKIIAVNRDEIGIIKNLWESLNAYHLAKSTRFKNHFSEFTFEKRMDALNRRDRLIVYVAEDKNESIGYCMASVDGLAGEIDSLFIKMELRNQGLGEELMILALRWLEKQNCKTIRVSIAEGNESALDFYRRFGFTERFVVMQRTHNQKTHPIGTKRSWGISDS